MKVCLGILTAREQEADKSFLTFLKDLLYRCNQNKRKTVASYITNLICSLLLLLTISLQLVANYSKCLQSLLVFTSILQLHSYRNHTKEISRIQWDYIWWFWKWSLFFEDSKKGRTNLFGNTSEESWFLIF